MRLEHHLVGGYVRYISPYIIIIITCPRAGMTSCRIQAYSLRKQRSSEKMSTRYYNVD